MKNPRPNLENWWVAEAMIASYNHVYQVTHKTKYKVHGPIGISIYDGAPVASFQYEFLALSADAQSVMDAVLAYPIPDDKQYVIDVFHPARHDQARLQPKFEGCGALFDVVRHGEVARHVGAGSHLDGGDMRHGDFSPCFSTVPAAAPTPAGAEIRCTTGAAQEPVTW